MARLIMVRWKITGCRRDEICAIVKKLPAYRAGPFGRAHGPEYTEGLPGNEDMIIGSALTPLRESVSALPAYRAGLPADLPVTVW